VIGAVVIAVVSLVLGTRQRTAYESFATESVRVGNPGHNLVGPDWSGDAVRRASDDGFVGAPPRDLGLGNGAVACDPSGTC
jgi:hypothetical protein